ncbi:MAG: hypothetical protein J6W79_02885 [Alphaproteobacteria bacterium]|nr:hypothetical protein [Alphaproteobacteria bacterium]
MKKTLKIVIAASVLTMPAFADTPFVAGGTLRNMENPLYLPSAGEIYSKIGFGVMYKITDSNDAQKKLFHDGKEEFPIWRPTLDLGFGITDRWAIHGQIGYTHNRDIERYGFHLGRLGTTYRIINNAGWVWDVYGDLHMGGIQAMKGALVNEGAGPTFSYDNYSNGRWGYHVGTKFGKVWDRWTTSAFVELLRTWGNHNNTIDTTKITLADLGVGPAVPLSTIGIPDEISVDLKSTTEYDLGANAFYQVNDRWSFGVGVKYVYHAENGIEKVHNKITNPTGQAVANGLIDNYKKMHDSFGEFAQSFTLAYQATDSMQIAWFLENTIDNGQRLNANTTDLKIETAIRLNVKF